MQSMRMRPVVTDLAWCVTTMSCAKTAEPIEVMFWMCTRVGPRNHILGGRPGPPGEGAICGNILRSVRENVCNNSKNVKVMFLDFEENVKNVTTVSEAT